MYAITLFMGDSSLGPLRRGSAAPVEKANLFDYRDAVEREVVTYCCDRCGFLESYALPVESRLTSVFARILISSHHPRVPPLHHPRRTQLTPSRRLGNRHDVYENTTHTRHTVAGRIHCRTVLLALDVPEEKCPGIRRHSCLEGLVCLFGIVACIFLFQGAKWARISIGSIALVFGVGAFFGEILPQGWMRVDKLADDATFVFSVVTVVLLFFRKYEPAAKQIAPKSD